MNLLLDTHALIWFLNGDAKLSSDVKTAIEDPDNSKIISIASIWEIAIKISIDKLRLPKDFMHFMDMIKENGFEILPITFEHAMIVSKLKFIHRDPFDRLIVAQCKADKLVLATKDENIRQYDIQTIW
jgi:PIN domain nuclease of toxin-antitoxin system